MAAKLSGKLQQAKTGFLFLLTRGQCIYVALLRLPLLKLRRKQVAFIKLHSMTLVLSIHYSTPKFEHAIPKPAGRLATASPSQRNPNETY
jgi:hypothetical protein